MNDESGLERDRQELYCHGCDRFVQWIQTFEVDGHYHVKCPNCGHDHYRSVHGGKVTDDRYMPYVPYVRVRATWAASTSAVSYSSSTSSTGSLFSSPTGGSLFRTWP